MKENINALDELNKGATMGIDAIHFILEKVEDEKFKKLLQDQSEAYQKISERVKDIYKKYNDDDKPHETGAMTKAMTWYGIEMKTFMDKSDSKIAELLLQGTNMGIIEGRRLLNNKETSEEVSNIMNEYVTMQEQYVESLKNYL